MKQQRLSAASINERRNFERRDVRCSALMRLSETLTFRATVVDLTVSGARVICDPSFALLLDPDSVAFLPFHASLQISIALETPTGTTQVTSTCILKHYDLQPDNTARIGLVFSDLGALGSTLIEGFLATLD